MDTKELKDLYIEAINKMKNAIINNENITCKEYLKQIEGEGNGR